MLQLRKKPTSKLALQPADFEAIADRTLQLVQERLNLKVGPRTEADYKVLDLGNSSEPNYHLDARVIEQDDGVYAQLQLRQLGVYEGGHHPTWTISQQPHGNASRMRVIYKQRDHVHHHLILDDQVRPEGIPAESKGSLFLGHLIKSASSYAHLR